MDAKQDNSRDYVLAITTMILTTVTAISFYTYRYMKGYKAQGTNMSVASYNAGFRLGRYTMVSDIIFCYNTVNTAILRAYRTIATIIYVQKNEISSLEYHCYE